MRWFDGAHRQLATGLHARTGVVAAGPGAVTVASASASYVLQQVAFPASFVQPAEGTDVLEGPRDRARSAARTASCPA